MPVVAAGAILWRQKSGQLEVLVIHRGRYDDYSWPKGKLDAGEHITTAAAREIREETGLKVKLGPFLRRVEYKIENDRDKHVYYWVAEVTDKILAKQKFKPDDEVSNIEWMPVEAAKAKLTYAYDIDLLADFEALLRDKALDTVPLIILRHAKAVGREEFIHGEAKRPLTGFGARQAVALRPMLAAFAIKSVVTSPWRRCFDTVSPFVAKHKVRLIEQMQLTELGNKQGPQRTLKVLEGILESGKGTVLCSHRPALPTIFDRLAKLAPAQLAEKIDAGKALRPGEFMVLHMTKPQPGSEPRIVAVETHYPPIED